jgi:hypothetical protein
MRSPAELHGGLGMSKANRPSTGWGPELVTIDVSKITCEQYVLFTVADPQSGRPER